MRFRPQIAANPADAPRESGTVKAVAAKTSSHPSTVRRLLAAGAYEGYRQGKRGIRIYLDSVADHQRRNTLPIERKPADQPKQPERRGLALNEPSWP